MERVDGPRAEAIVDQMRRSLYLTGCRFAMTHGKAATSHIGFVVFSTAEGTATAPHEIADPIMDELAAESDAAALVLPEVRDEEGVVSILRALSFGERWTVEIRPRKKHPHQDVLVAVWWRTRDGARTSVLGMAPFGTMPPTRRAPYVTLAAWPGSPQNRYRDPKPGEVGFVDMRLPTVVSTVRAYRRMWDTTRARVRAISEYPRDGAGRPDVAFVLPERCRTAVEEFASPP